MGALQWLWGDPGLSVCTSGHLPCHQACLGFPTPPPQLLAGSEEGWIPAGSREGGGSPAQKGTESRGACRGGAGRPEGSGPSFLFPCPSPQTTARGPGRLPTHLGFSRGSGSLRARPTGFFSASSAVRRCNSASTLPCRKEQKDPRFQAGHWALSTSAWPSPALRPSSGGPHRELELIILIAGQEGPPAFDALLLEDGNQGHIHLAQGHLHGALLGCLGAPGKPVQVQLDGPCGSLGVSSDGLGLGWPPLGWAPPASTSPRHPLHSPALHPGSRPRRSGQRPRSAG